MHTITCICNIRKRTHTHRQTDIYNPKRLPAQRRSPAETHLSYSGCTRAAAISMSRLSTYTSTQSRKMSLLAHVLACHW